MTPRLASLCIFAVAAFTSKLYSQTLYWDGPNIAPDGTVNGGTGTWDNTATNWTNSAGTLNSTWASDTGIFQGTAGTVSIGAIVTVRAMRFEVDNYQLMGGVIDNTLQDLDIDVINGVTTTISSTIGGSSGLIKNGAGTLQLPGTNEYGGNTRFNAGLLIAGSDNSIGGGQSALFFDGGFLGASANFSTARMITIEDGGGGFAPNSGIVLTVNSSMTGVGSLTVRGPGRTDLTAANTYAGGTVVESGTLAVSNSAALGDGPLQVNGGTLLLNSNLTTGFLSGTGGTIDVDAGDLTVNQTTDGTFDGDISGFGALIKNGTGGLTLNGTASQFGGTTINGGTLFVANGMGSPIENNATLNFIGTGGIIQNGAISGGGNVVMSGSGALTLGGANSYTGGTTISDGRIIATAATLPGDVVNNATLEFAQGTDDTFAGDISGTGGLFKTGAGRLLLTGTNTYAGLTFITEGTLAVDADSLAGNVSNSAVLEFAQGTDDTFGGDLAGVGSLVKTGTGRLLLTGSNTLVGGITVTAGTLAGGAGAFFGDIDNDGTVELIGGGTVSGDISGTGLLLKTGGGRMELTGTNTYTGGTTVTGGTLAGDADALVGMIANAGTVEFAQPTDDTFAGIVTGAGDVVKTGAGRLLLTGANTFMGGITISEGTLAGNTDSLPASTIANNATLEFAQDTDDGFAEIITGSGNVEKTGTGRLLLTGVNTFTGGILITDGTLAGNSDALPGNIDNNSTLEVIGNGDLAGDISGTGNLMKTGAGRLLLSGTNTYTGGTEIAGGTLAGDSNSLTGDILNNSTLEFAQGINGAFGGDVSGTGDVTKTGPGRILLTGTNTYTGGTTVTDGTLAGDTDSLRGDIDNDAILEFAQTTDATYGGVISGTGLLMKTGGGSLALTGPNSFTGGTLITDGTLVVDSASLPGNVENDSTLQFDQVGAGTFGGDISGTGELVKSSAGRLLLTGNNTFTGGTDVTGGILAGNPNALPGDINNDATLELLGNGRMNGDISGSGGLLKTGAGRVLLTGTNTYTGGTSIAAGTLAGNSNSLTGDILNMSVLEFAQAGDGTFGGDVSGAGEVTKTGGGRLLLTGANTYTGGTTITDGTLAGDTDSLTGDFVNDAFLEFLQRDDGTFGGVVSGSGVVVKTGDGRLTFTGENSYTGGTVITDGTLAGDTDSIRGDILNNAFLDFLQRDDGEFTGDISGTGMVVKSGAGRLLLSGNNTFTGGIEIDAGTLAGDSESLNGDILNNAFLEFLQRDRGTFAGNISGSGLVLKTGGGRLLLTGDNSYAGGTEITDGTLAGDSDSLTGDILNNSVLEFAQTGGGTFAGVISGTGVVNKTGTGRLLLTGANTWTGGTTITEGVLAGNTDSLVGDIENNGILEFVQDSTGEFSGNVSGVGVFVKTGTGRLVLSGANTYTGGTTVFEGTLVVDTDSLPGNVGNDATLEFNQTTDGTYAFEIGGSGTVVKTGEGSLTLTGQSTYTGLTEITDGTLVIKTNSLVGPIENNSKLVFDQNGNGQFAGDISGIGSLEKLGDGRVVLTGNNTFTGGILITDGTLAGSLLNLPGAIVNNSVLELIEEENIRLNRNITGTGDLIKNGDGTLQIVTDQSYTGTTTVNEGALLLNAKLNSSVVTIGTEALIGGEGLVEGDLVNMGVLSPGNSPGTFRIGGDLTLAGSSDTMIEIESARRYDRIVVGQVARLNGRLVVVLLRGFDPAPGAEFTIITAKRVNGRFSSEVLPSSVPMDVEYKSKSVVLSISADTRRPYPDFARSRNQLDTAIALERLRTQDLGTKSDFDRNIRPVLDFLPGPLLRTAFEAIMPNQSAVFSETLFSRSRVWLAQMATRMADIRAGSHGFVSSGFNERGASDMKDVMAPVEENRWGVWVDGSGVFNEVAGIGTLRSGHASSGEGTAGVDYRLSDAMTLGFYTGYVGSWTYFPGNSEVDSNGSRFGIYSTWQSGGFYLNNVIGGEFNAYDWTRQINFPGISRTATAETDGTVFETMFGGGHDWKFGNMEAGLFCNLEYTLMMIDGFTESGAGSLNLRISDQDAESLRTNLGAQLMWNVPVAGRNIRPSIRAAWRHEYLDYNRTVNSALVGGAGPGFGTSLPGGRRRDSLLLNGGFTMEITDNVSGYLYYTGDLGSGDTENIHAVNTGLRVAF